VPLNDHALNVVYLQPLVNQQGNTGRSALAYKKCNPHSTLSWLAGGCGCGNQTRWSGFSVGSAIAKRFTRCCRLDLDSAWCLSLSVISHLTAAIVLFLPWYPRGASLYLAICKVVSFPQFVVLASYIHGAIQHRSLHTCLVNSYLDYS